MDPLAVTPLPISIFPQPLTITSLLLVSINLPILDIPQKWNHTVQGLLYLVPFTQHVLKVYSFYSMCQHFI